MEKAMASQRRRAITAFIGIAVLMTSSLPVMPDTAAPAPLPSASVRGGMFPQQSGEAIYKGVCQGCHMPDAKGAVGAGSYPALANNPNLQVAGYPITVIVQGQKAMPPLGPYFSDGQIANVVNYIRSHFGNHYSDSVTPADVKAVR